MSWLFSQALVEEYLGENFSDGEQSAPLNGSLTPQAYCAPDKMTAFSRLSRFGMTFKPLTESRGQELLTLYLADFHAKTSAQQEKAQELMENDQDSRKRWQGLLGKYDPATHSLKTAQCSLFGDLIPSSVILPRWGSMQTGELYQRQTLVRPTAEKESGLWPTPCAMDSSATMVETQEQWETRNREKKAKNPKLGEVQKSLRSVVTWPTPVCQDSRHATTRHLDPKNQHWKSNLGEVVMSLEKPNIGGRLNPTWVEWLMGWPLGWTDLKPLEMDKSHFAPQQLGESL